MSIKISGDIDSLELILGFTLPEAVNDGGTCVVGNKRFDIISIETEHNAVTEAFFGEYIDGLYKPRTVWSIEFIVTKTKRGL